MTVKARGFKSFDIMKQLIDGVWEYSLINPDGFTLNIETIKQVSKYL